MQEIYNQIYNKTLNYVKEHNIKSITIGISGGLDSSVNTFIFNKICKELDIPLNGRYIHIESNKEDEKERAILFGNMYCTVFDTVDLTPLYNFYIQTFEPASRETDMERKIRRGNIKARLRMLYLYDLNQINKGIVSDNDNKTERELGFWTLNGDVGDIVPLASLWKTDVFELAKYIRDNLCENEVEVNAFNMVINAIPTDGLGITSSDVEQFGAKSYDEVDDILKSYISKTEDDINYWNIVVKPILYEEYGKNVVDNVIKRHLNSEFKRNHPYRIRID